MNKPTNNIRLNRIISAVLDQFIMTCIMMLVMTPVFLVYFFYTETYDVKIEQGDYLLAVPACIGLAIYFCKDIFNGRSIARRMLSAQLIKSKTGEVAGPFSTFIRSLFILIWPLEFIMLIINPDRRLADFLLGTAHADYDPERKQVSNFRIKQLLTFLVALIFSYAFIAMNFE